MFFKSTVATALLASFVVAQSSNVTFDASTVDPSLRSQWCTSQDNTCTSLCGDDNIGRIDCDPATLITDCLCASNNSSPGLQYYAQSMASLICQRIFQNCITANVGNSTGQAECTDNQKKNCGTLNVDDYTPPQTSSSSSASSTPTATPSESSAGAAATTSSSNAAAIPTMVAARELGAGVLAAGIAAAFGLML